MYQANVNPYSSRQGKPRLAEHMLYAADKLKDGRPSIYRLPMREENRHANSTFARRSIGWPHDNRQAGVFLLVGTTGAGKSTLINGMANYIMGVEWMDDFRFKVTTDDSQTKDITAYTFHPMEHSPVQYSFTVIDTPGFGAAQGLKTDEEIAEQINKFFSYSHDKRIDYVNGIGFVIPASQASLTPTQEYIFDSILSMFGKDVYKNIVMLHTFADCHRPPVLEPRILNPQIPNHQHVKFNNSGLFADNKNLLTNYDQTFNGMFWNMSFISFKSFFEVFLGMFDHNYKGHTFYVPPLPYVRRW